MIETHLGDGAYAKYEDGTFTLWADRRGGRNYVVLEPEALEVFLAFIGRVMGLEITVKHKAEASLTPEAGRDLAKEEPCEQ
jgi:hypothetical protein